MLEKYCVGVEPEVHICTPECQRLPDPERLQREERTEVDWRWICNHHFQSSSGFYLWWQTTSNSGWKSQQRCGQKGGRPASGTHWSPQLLGAAEGGWGGRGRRRSCSLWPTWPARHGCRCRRRAPAAAHPGAWSKASEAQDPGGEGGLRIRWRPEPGKDNIIIKKIFKLSKNIKHFI